MKKLITILLTVAICVVGFGLIGVNAKLNDSIKTRDLKVTEYKVGSLGATGKEVESTASIISKEFINVDGLTITLSDDANVTYKLFFYDNEEEFISATDELSADSNTTTVVEGAKYFKIMITPTGDSEVSTLEISKYAKRVTVTVNK